MYPDVNFIVDFKLLTGMFQFSVTLRWYINILPEEAAITVLITKKTQRKYTAWSECKLYVVKSKNFFECCIPYLLPYVLPKQRICLNVESARLFWVWIWKWPFHAGTTRIICFHAVLVLRAQLLVIVLHLGYRGRAVDDSGWGKLCFFSAMPDFVHPRLDRVRNTATRSSLSESSWNHKWVPKKFRKIQKGRAISNFYIPLENFWSSYWKISEMEYQSAPLK